MEHDIKNLFASPVYTTHRESGLDSIEKKEIEDMLDGGIEKKGKLQDISIDTYIFDTKLKKLKEFCEQHIKIYVEEVINPKEELDFYITQSWLNVIKPGALHPPHQHPNSIISGVFYLRQDKTLPPIQFSQSNQHGLKLDPRKYNVHNAETFLLPCTAGELILFPSNLKHSVPTNVGKEARISLSFNTFSIDILGSKDSLTHLDIRNLMHESN